MRKQHLTNRQKKHTGSVADSLTLKTGKSWQAVVPQFRLTKQSFAGFPAPGRAPVSRFRPGVLQCKPVAGNSVVQRYIENDLKGELDAVTYGWRAGGEDMGLNGIGTDNRGWISVKDKNNESKTIKKASQHSAAHTEELLLQQVEKDYTQEIFKNDPAVADKDRIIEVYTERRPCGAANEKVDSYRGKREHGSCDSMLKKKLHPNVRVSFSVENSDKGYNNLKAKMYDTYYDDIIENRRQITAGNMQTRNGKLYYQQSIRKMCFDKHKEYGRDYETEYGYLKMYQKTVKDMYDTEISGFIDFVGLPHFDKDLASKLNDSFIAPHRTDTDAVVNKMKNAAENCKKQITSYESDVEFSLKNTGVLSDNDPDEKQEVIAKNENPQWKKKKE